MSADAMNCEVTPRFGCRCSCFDLGCAHATSLKEVGIGGGWSQPERGHPDRRAWRDVNDAMLWCRSLARGRGI